MTDDSLLHVDPSLSIPRSELEYRATRSGGPGGQHVNTSSTRVELTWNVRASAALSDEQRTLVMEKLQSRIDTEGVLRLVGAASRSQYQNREAVTERLAKLVAGALRQPKPRKRTRPPKASKEARLQGKKQRSQVKQRRGRVSPDE